MFHDIFGHIPLLLDPYAQFMEDFGKHGVANLKSSTYSPVAKLVLVHYRIWRGSYQNLRGGIISSFGKRTTSLIRNAIYPFELEKVLGNSFINSEIQGHYYRIGGIDAVYGIDFKHIH